MKITNWCKKLSAALVAAGVLAPAASYAIDIPLGDPSFELFQVLSPPNYAYANLYRPTSPWVDDLDNPPGYTQDNVASSWLYNAAYAEADVTPPINKRPAPRTLNQAMHGLANYSAQETSAVFEAGRTYTFSLWAQNDEVLDQVDGLFMYIFDGTVPFSDANSLANLGGAFTAINKRQPGMTPAESQANWTKVSVSHSVAAGAPEIGHPVGVGFFARRDTAVDDASLTSVVPEPATVLLVGIGSLAALGLRRRE
jgi:PEP-CTERM motif